jgi:hypothetical protein
MVSRMTTANTANVLEAKTNVRASASSKAGLYSGCSRAGAQAACSQGGKDDRWIAGTMLLSVIVFVIVSLLVSLGVLWLTGSVVRGAVIGVVCGFAAAIVLSAVSTVAERTGELPHGRVGNENERSNGRAAHRAR